MSPSDPPTHHGLVYPPGFLDRLHVIQARPLPHSPIRLLSAHDFATIHHLHLTAHAPDNILFPFLHGIEGSNEAQNLFFAHGTANGGKAKPVQVPPYRGLVWVVCDDDLDPDITLPSARAGASEGDLDDDLDDNFSDGSSSYIVDPEHFAMDVDPDHDPEGDIHNQGEPGSVGQNNLAGDLKHANSHMHPVAHRSTVNVPSRPPLITKGPIIDPSPADQHVSYERRASTASSTFSTSTGTDSLTQFSPTSSTISSPPTSLASSFPPEKFPPAKNAMTSSLPSSPLSPISSQRPKNPPLMTSTFRPRDLLLTNSNGDPQPVFGPLRVPEGISLRNFGIQVPIYATISDIVVYSPKGLTRSSIALTNYFKTAVEEKALERRARLRANSEFLFEAADGPDPDLLTYNVFLLSATVDKLREVAPHLMVRVAPDDTRRNTVDFAEREKKEMRELTRASEIISVFSSGAEPYQPQATATASGTEGWDPTVGQVFLGNANDVPFTHESLASSPASSAYSCSPHLSRQPSAADLHSRDDDASIDPFNFATNDPSHGRGYDICVECRDYAPFPSSMHFRAAEEHFHMLDSAWEERCRRCSPMGEDGPISPRPPPNASAVIHLPFPSSPRSPRSGTETLNELFLTVRFLERMLQPPTPPTSPSPEPECTQTSSPSARRWSSVSSLLSSSPTQPLSASSPATISLHTSPPVAPRTRPLKVLLYSSDGYTESSVLALCLLMAVRRISLPEAYLELQVARRRSFFVHQADLTLLRRVEVRLAAEREVSVVGPSPGPGSAGRGGGRGRGVLGWSGFSFHGVGSAGRGQGHPYRRPAANSVSSPHSPLAMPAGLSSARIVVPSQGHLVRSRPRANTSPWPPSLFSDHQTWFNDPRFDGSFPSRVLPFLYLGNLNHASNAYMLHALGITHVVSVGECALIPPPHINSVLRSSTNTISHPSFGGGGHFIAGKGPGHDGSLWIEEREGRIKVLDIKGVCDDGIDTLEPQLGHICDWIEHARTEGGQVLVHCRVGVSRSATVTIAYVMKHLGLPLVDAYLIVRSRRLSVLIQPNMRLLYNLCGWEVKLARERAGGDEERLKVELAGSLNWPYLAKEVHALNQKYLSFDN